MNRHLLARAPMPPRSRLDALLSRPCVQSAPIGRSTAIPVAVALALLFAPLPAAAQTDTRLRGSAHFGVNRLSAFDLYDGVVGLGFLRPRTADGEPAAAFGVQSQYRERLVAPIQFELAGTITRNDRTFVEVRGARGKATTEASLSGGTAPRQGVPGTASWNAFSALFGFRLLSSGPIDAQIYAGPNWWFWTVRGDAERTSSVATDAVSQTQYPLDLPWNDVSGRGRGLTLGVSGRFALPAGAALVAGGEYRFGNQNVARLGIDHRARLEAEVAELSNLTYERSAWSGGALRFGVEWTFGRTVLKDPGERAIASMEEAGRGSAPGTGIAPEVVDMLASGDTLAAIETLEALLPSRDGDASVIGTLGLLLARTASASEAAPQARQRALALLDRALRLDPGNARFLIAYGVALEKVGVERDARRATTRGIAAAAQRPETLTRRELAEAFFRRARTLETRVQEFEGLRRPPARNVPVNTPECGGLGAFCMNFSRPAAFFDLVYGSGGSLEDLIAEERAAMLREYERALALDSVHEGANRGLIAAHARANDWEGVLARAREYSRTDPTSAWAHIFLAMAMAWTGRSAEAAPHFTRGMADLAPEDRAIFDDVRLLLPRQEEAEWDAADETVRPAVREALWENLDPLFLTEASEREQEHYARVALAELLFGEAQSDRRGWNSDRGQILVRYGRPAHRWQLVRDDARIGGEAGANQFTGGERALPGGGRWIFWKYGREEPAFIFEKQLGFTGVRHMSRSQSFAFQEDLRATAPSKYAPEFLDTTPIPHQVARFRRGGPGEHELVVFASIPPVDAAPEVLAPGRALRADRAQRGFFLRRESTSGFVTRVVEPANPGGSAFDVRTELGPGIYTYSLEAVRPDQPAAVERGRVVVGTYSSSRLRLSDLLLASDVGPPSGDVAPERWSDVSLRPLRCLRVPGDRSVAIVFEAYGLAAEDGVHRYRVELSAGEAPTSSFAVRLLRGLRNLVDAPDEGSLSFEREIEAGGPRVVEWFQLQLGEHLPSQVALEVRVSDLVGREQATTRRTLNRDSCAAAM